MVFYMMPIFKTFLSCIIINNPYTSLKSGWDLDFPEKRVD